MTTEDYVSYPIALALKRAGFEWKCHYGYSVKMRLEPEPSFGEPKMVHSKAPKNYNDNRKGIEKGLEFCSCVPLWQAQKWLREKKDIVVVAEPDWDEEIQCLSDYLTGKWYFSVWKDNNRIRCNFNPNIEEEKIWMFDTYEQALSAGIAAALELIKKKGE